MILPKPLSWFKKNDDRVIEKGGIKDELLYVIYAIILAALSVITGEIVTFIMLGFILLTLTNINNNLKKMNEKMEQGKKNR